MPLSFVASLLFSVGCVGAADAPAETSLREICADPASFDGQLVTIAVDLSSAELELWGGSVARCGDEDPCCNVGMWVHRFSCGDTTSAILVPRDEGSLDDPYVCTAATGNAEDFDACGEPVCNRSGEVVISATATLEAGRVRLEPLPAE